METIQDFEDMLRLLEKYSVKYLIMGGLAFIFHAKPRYTKDMDLWIDPSHENVVLANTALAEFGSPLLLDAEKVKEILQLGVAPNRIDLHLHVPGARFEQVWKKRILGWYGDVKANWIDLDNLVRIKTRIDDPRHKEDVRVLKKVKKYRREALKKKQQQITQP